MSVFLLEKLGEDLELEFGQGESLTDHVSVQSHFGHEFLIFILVTELREIDFCHLFDQQGYVKLELRHRKLPIQGIRWSSFQRKCVILQVFLPPSERFHPQILQQLPIVKQLRIVLLGFFHSGEKLYQRKELYLLREAIETQLYQGLVQLKRSEESSFPGKILHQTTQIHLILEVGINPFLQFLARL